ncbi:MAG: hypothetical protein M5T61_05875 [Acidimicrobiia bacterium]|nr:hypothetical protein [Acidimicrobiia bacterium]
MEVGVAVGEDAAVAGDEPVPLTRGGGRDPEQGEARARPAEGPRSSASPWALTELTAAVPASTAGALSVPPTVASETAPPAESRKNAPVRAPSRRLPGAVPDALRRRE